MLNLLEGSNPSPSAMNAEKNKSMNDALKSPDPLVVTELAQHGAATVGESGGRTMAARIKPAWTGAQLVAPAYPVQCTTGDNLAIHYAVTRAPVGSVLVVDVGTEREFGYWGEVLTTAAITAGLAGLIIDGCVRDAAALTRHKFSVFSTGLALPGASKNSGGMVGDPVMAGGVMVAAGDWVVADVDGVSVIAAAELDNVVLAARARTENEEVIFDRLRAGESTIEILGLDSSVIKDADA